MIQEHNDNEPTLILVSFNVSEQIGEVFLNEENVHPHLKTNGDQENQSNIWYLDTGASNHMTGHRYKFRDLNKMIQGYMKFGNGFKV